MACVEERHGLVRQNELVGGLLGRLLAWVRTPRAGAPAKVAGPVGRRSRRNGAGRFVLTAPNDTKVVYSRRLLQ